MEKSGSWSFTTPPPFLLSSLHLSYPSSFTCDYHSKEILFSVLSTSKHILVLLKCRLFFTTGSRYEAKVDCFGWSSWVGAYLKWGDYIKCLLPTWCLASLYSLNLKISTWEMSGAHHSLWLFACVYMWVCGWQCACVSMQCVGEHVHLFRFVSVSLCALLFCGGWCQRALVCVHTCLCVCAFVCACGWVGWSLLETGFLTELEGINQPIFKGAKQLKWKRLFLKFSASFKRNTIT